MSAALARLTDALESKGCKPRGKAALCPAHEDRAPSLSFAAADQFAGVVVKCQAGCSTVDVVEALGLTTADLFDEAKQSRAGYAITAEYAYTDEHGEVLFLKERRFPKDFRCKRPGGAWGIGDVRRVLYRLPEVVEAVRTGQPVYVVEGEKDADALARLGHTATCNFDGAGKWKAQYGDVLRGADVVVIADKDAAGRAHAADLHLDLTGKATSVKVLEAATGKDVSDHLAAGKTLDELVPVTPRTTTLSEVHAVFRRWLGPSFDLTALDAVLASAAVERLDGDPVWLLVVSGSGNAKTETVSALAGAGAHVTSTITSEGALLSATSKKETAKDSTGGLLRKIGDRGVVVVKDFTSILSMNRDSRAAVLAALREVYDGRWERNVGTDGGRTLTWDGRIVLIGAVTTAYDQAHAVISSMGDRFALVRVDSNLGRLEAGRQALTNVGHEIQMRAELATAVGDLLTTVKPELAILSDKHMAVLLGAANLVTLSRTAVERDYRGQVLEAHAPEAPTRFAKMLGQVVRGALALGVDPEQALQTAMRVAGDSVPPLRLDALHDVLEHPYSRTSDVTKRLQRPRSTVDRTLQELHLLGLVVVDEVDDGQGWRYTLHPDLDAPALLAVVTRNVTTPGYREKEERQTEAMRPATDISGDALTLAVNNAACELCGQPASHLDGDRYPYCKRCRVGADPILNRKASA
jgi:5S rRNA maturation endonuclease (ribonuclease M5)